MFDATIQHGRVLESHPTPIRLDLGCGPGKKPGFIGCDHTAFPGVDLVCDLSQARWVVREEIDWMEHIDGDRDHPIHSIFKDNSIEEAHSSHFFEHLDAMQRVAFLNELFRVLKPGAKCTLIAPHWSSCRAYGDPTHKWPPVSEFAFFYWKKDWRMANSPHTDYSVLKGGFNCNFEVTWGYSLNPEVAQRNQEYQQYAMNHLKEAVMDVIATLTAIK